MTEEPDGNLGFQAESEQLHRENDPHYFPSEPDEPQDDGEDDHEMQMECPYCDGSGWWYGEGIAGECAECGGTGWY